MIRHDFSGRVAMVTGGTSGIGLATARAFARAGARVVVTARGEAAGAAACALLEADGAGALFVPADVRREPEVARAVELVLARLGRLDCAVNCAGAGGDHAPLERTDQAAWDDVFAVNARGVWLCMRHQALAMLTAGRGAIVNVSSIYGAAARAAEHAYVASKHAVVAMTRTVAIELARRGVRVNVLLPGVTRTPAMRQAEAAVPDLVAGLVAEHPMARMASEDEVAAAALWLCSDDAGYVTGAGLAVDGGFLAA